MPFSFFSFLLCGSNSVGSLLHRLKDKPGHGGAKGRLWRELSEGVFPSLNKAGETGMARRLMRMLEEDFPQLQCHQPVQDDTPLPPLPSPPSELVCASASRLPQNATAAFQSWSSWLPPSANLSEHCLPQGRCFPVWESQVLFGSLSVFLSDCGFSFAGVRRAWAAEALTAQHSRAANWLADSHRVLLFSSFWSRHVCVR